MAVGDGWTRHIWVKFDGGSAGLIEFGDFNPTTMEPATAKEIRHAVMSGQD
jgi:hypothetical protein